MNFFEKNINHSLIEALCKGDGEVFRFVIECSRPSLAGFIFKLVKCQNETEDILQEVYIRLWTNRLHLDANKSLESYLYTISKRLVIDFYRKASLDKSLIDKIIHSVERHSNTTEEAIAYKDSLRYFQTILESLPKQQRAVFQMAKMEGLSYEAISEELQVSKSTISNHLMEAKKKLKARFFLFDFIFLLFFIGH